MQIVVQSDGDGGSVPATWAIIELQGVLESVTGEHLSGQFIGSLNYTKQVSMRAPLLWLYPEPVFCRATR
jgi:hypothetical protein